MLRMLSSHYPLALACSPCPSSPPSYRNKPTPPRTPTHGSDTPGCMRRDQPRGRQLCWGAPQGRVGGQCFTNLVAKGGERTGKGWGATGSNLETLAPLWGVIGWSLEGWEMRF
eukprot:764280-Hanusia_phi.AAC.4